MLFSYKVVGGDGKVEEGSARAESRAELARRFENEGKTPVFIGQEEGGGLLKKLASVELLSRIKPQEKINFARNLSAMIDAGLPISRALSVSERQTRNKKLKRVFSFLGSSIEKGNSLSRSLSEFPKVFPPLFVSMVSASEESGNLSKSLETIADYMDRANRLKKRIRVAMLYPSVIISAMIVVGLLLFIFVVPTLTDTFRELNVDLPASTRAIIGMSDFLGGNKTLTVITLLTLIVASVIFFRTKVGKRAFEFSVLRTPVIGQLVKETNSARTARTLSSLLSSGVEVVKALEITGEVMQNSYYKEVISLARENIQKGAPVSEVFIKRDDLYPVLVGEMVGVGEETGKISELLLRIAIFYEEEVEQKTKNLSSIIEPILMVIVGVAVGFFAIAMISPTYSLVGGL